MAWGSWSTYQTEVLSNDNYSVLVEWGYRKDVVGNITQIRTLRLGIKSKTKYHSFTSASTTVGLTAPGVAHSECIQQKLTVSVSPSSTTWVDLPDTYSSSIAHSSSGVFPNGYHIDWYLNSSIDIIGAPSGMTGTSWHKLSLDGKIASINRSAGSIYVDSATAGYSKISGKIHMQYWGSIYAKIPEHSNSWTKIGETSKDGESISYSFTGLKPGTAYTVQTYGKRTYNGVSTSTASKKVTTKSVPAPSLPLLTVSEITTTGAKLTLASGGTVYDSTSDLEGYKGALNLCLYEGVQIPTGSFSASQTEVPFTYREYMTADAIRAGYTIQAELKPNTLYGIQLWSSAPLSNAKGISATTFRTLSDSKSVYIMTEEGWKKGVPYIYTGTEWVQGVPYVKTDTAWNITSE